MFIKRTIIHTVRLCGALSECWLIWRPLKLKLVCNLTVKSPDKFVEKFTLFVLTADVVCWWALIFVIARRTLFFGGWMIYSLLYLTFWPASICQISNDFFQSTKHCQQNFSPLFSNSFQTLISFEEFHFSLSKFLFKNTKLVTILITI